MRYLRYGSITLKRSHHQVPKKSTDPNILKAHSAIKADIRIIIAEGVISEKAFKIFARNSILKRVRRNFL